MQTTDAIVMIKQELAADAKLANLVEEEMHRLKIAEKIRQARKHTGLSQRELAKRIKTTQSVVSRLESNNYERLSLQTLLKISAVLNCDLIIDLKPRKIHKTNRRLSLAN